MIAIASAVVGAISTMPFTGGPTETRPSALATSSGRCGIDSKNCVARTIEYGIEDSLISSSCASFARK